MSPVWVDALDDVTVYVFGTLGGNTPAIAIEGSPVNTGTPTSAEFAPLTTGGVAISLNAVKTCAVIDPSTLWVKPVLTGGDGSTDLTVWVVAK